MLCTIFLLATITLLLVGYFYVKKKYSYWEERGVPYLKPTFPLGNLWGAGYSKHTSELIVEYYRKMKGQCPIGGIYFLTQPMATILDLDLLKNILVKDFQYFHDRGMYVNERDDPLSGHLFALSGQKWKLMRAKLTPTFTSGKMKMMHSTIVAVAEEFQNFLEPYANSEEVIEFKNILARFTTDVIGSCAFGIECNTLKNPKSDFLRVGSKISDLSGFRFIKIMFIMVFPNLAKNLRMCITPKEVDTFFINLLRETIQNREENNVKRNDFLSLLIQLKNTGKLEGDSVDLGTITFEELAAQTQLFFGAGFDTSSHTMAFSFYELALNQDIQEQLRNEVQTVLEKHGGEFTYEACMEMKYLDMIIRETLRKYPVLDNLVREATNAYTIPGTNHVIEKGIGAFIPVFAIHRDPEIYPNPERFDPNRFIEDEIAKRHPMAWIPFGEGPRMCVGMRFGMMQVRLGLASVVNKYRIQVTQKTPIPIVFDPNSAFLASKGGMWLKIEKI
ncbi:Cytochrome P450 [Sergentomyia squamirostris]